MDAHSFNDVEMVQGQGVETPIGAEVDAADSTVTSELQKKEELENVKRRLKEIEEEASNLRAKFGIEKPEEGGQDLAAATVTPTLAEKEEADSRSIFVGNVDYECTPEEVQEHFQFCGTVNRVTIVNDGFGHPKGFAYVEFAESEAVQNALALHETELHGRPIKVFPKRTNLPGITQNRERRVSRRILNPGPPMFSSYSYGRYPRSRPSMRYNPY